MLSAIRKHTVGAAEMSIFDQIIFLSDYIEPTRKYKNCIDTYDYVISHLNSSYENNISVINSACLMEIENTIESLTARGIPVCQTTYLARNCIKEKI